MFGYILLAIFIWVMYNFVVKFVLPIYRTSQQLKSKFSDIKQKQDAYNRTPNQPVSAETSSEKEKEGEYIEFEEVK